MHLSISKLTIIGSDNGLLPGRHQAIIWTDVGIVFIGPLETNFNEIWIQIHTFSFKNIHLKVLDGKWVAIFSWPQCVNILWSDGNGGYLAWIFNGKYLVLIQCLLRFVSEDSIDKALPEAMMAH